MTRTSRSKRVRAANALSPEYKFYSIDDLVSAGYGSRTTIYREMKDGKLPYLKIGGRVLIPRDQFNAYIEGFMVNRIQITQQ